MSFSQKYTRSNITIPTAAHGDDDVKINCELEALYVGAASSLIMSAAMLVCLVMI